MGKESGKDNIVRGIRVENAVGVSELVVDSACRAIELVLKDRGVNNISFLKFGTTHKEEHPDYELGSDEVAAEYNMHTKGIYLYTKSTAYPTYVRGFGGEDVAATAIAAHESTHVLQDLEGRVYANGELANTDITAYQDSDIEVEAWENAFHVLKHFYPTIRGDVTILNRKYIVPHKSNYD